MSSETYIFFFLKLTLLLDMAHINLPVANRQKKTAIEKKGLRYDFQKRI